MNDRTCIVQRRQAPADELIRFVVGPDGSVVPDLRRKLPGRGCWVTAERLYVDKAVARKLFSKAFKREAVASSDLSALIDRLMVQDALGAMGLARKAGALAFGAVKVEKAVREGGAWCVVHAQEASSDGVRKIDQARRATERLGGPATPAYKLFSEADLSLALGGTNVIHAAVLAQDAGKAALKRLSALDRYRGGTPDDQGLKVAATDESRAAEDFE